MKRIVLIVLVAFTLQLSAQVDEKAKSILEKVSETTQSYESLTATFSYIMENKEEDIHEENKGEIILNGNKYKLNLYSMGLEIYSDGNTIWTFMKDANEVSIAEFDDEMNESLDPSKLFTIYQEGFDYKFIEEGVSDGKSVYVIDLFPEDEEMEYSKMTIEIDKARMLVGKATMYGREGSNYIVQVKELQTNQPVSEGTFVFQPDKYPDVEVIDLR